MVSDYSADTVAPVRHGPVRRFVVESIVTGIRCRQMSRDSTSRRSWRCQYQNHQANSIIRHIAIVICDVIAPCHHQQQPKLTTDGRNAVCRRPFHRFPTYRISTHPVGRLRLTWDTRCITKLRRVLSIYHQRCFRAVRSRNTILVAARCNATMRPSASVARMNRTRVVPQSYQTFVLHAVLVFFVAYQLPTLRKRANFLIEFSSRLATLKGLLCRPDGTTFGSKASLTLAQILFPQHDLPSRVPF